MALVPPKSEAIPQNIAPQATAEPAIEAPAVPAQDQQAPVAPEAAPAIEPPSQPIPLPLEAALAPQAAEKPQAAEVEAPAAPPVAENDNSAPIENAAPQPAEASPAPIEAPPLDPVARVAALLAQGIKGPAEVRIADRATMWLPAGRSYLFGRTGARTRQGSRSGMEADDAGSDRAGRRFFALACAHRSARRRLHQIGSRRARRREAARGLPGWSSRSECAARERRAAASGAGGLAQRARPRRKE